MPYLGLLADIRTQFTEKSLEHAKNRMFRAYCRSRWCCLMNIGGCSKLYTAQHARPSAGCGRHWPCLTSVATELRMTFSKSVAVKIARETRYSTIMESGPKNHTTSGFSALIPQWHSNWILWVVYSEGLFMVREPL